MKPKKTKKRVLSKRLHRWPGVILSLFLILYAVSGIIMNHRNVVSGIDISRKILPDKYGIDNWNNGAVKGAVNFTDSVSVIYGGIGVWITYDSYNSFVDFNRGFPEGSDNRNITCLNYTKNDNLFAGTKFGLYRYSKEQKQWVVVDIPTDEKRIEGITTVNDSLWVMTRSQVLVAAENDPKFVDIELKAPEGYKSDISLFRTLWYIHSGELFGMPGKLFVDALGLLVIVLSVTGILYMFMPGFMRRRKNRKRSNKISKPLFSKSVKWHRVLGIAGALFLFILALTGMFLRPPLLIPIANTDVQRLKYTHLDNDNAWFLKLRGIHYDDVNSRFIILTNSGFYYTDKFMKSTPVKFESQPPYSVMGVNVFRQVADNEFMVGSFSGLYLWNTESGLVFDYIKRTPYRQVKKMGPPVSENMISGYIENEQNEFIFDYARGCVTKSTFGDVPHIIKQQGMPLWNVALEVHTGRIFEPILGIFYILYIPLTGIFTLILIITGAFIWIKKRVKSKKS
ncbi:MAG: PepSY domain-containing protein [Bacteroidales bacterium]|jgi:hypothetical protein|nr:PepSY domain-containing protein [Bacteroidales bacterium]